MQVHPGRIVTWNDLAAHTDWLQAQPWRTISLASTRVVQSGANACSLALTLAENGTSFESLILVTRRDGHWGFQGESTMEREVT